MRIPEPAVDALLALAVATAVGVAVAADVAGPPDREPAATAAGLGSAVVLGALLLVRRRFPVAVLLATAAVLLVHYALGLPAVGLAVPAAAALYSAAEAGRTRWAVATAAGLVVVATAARAREGDDPGFLFGIELASAVLTMVAVVVLGDAVRSRRLLRAAQRRLTERMAADREREAARRVQDERLRIARDLHDVLAHGLAVVSVQAAVAAEAVDDDPAAARSALAAVRSAGSTALTDLRATLGLLRDGPDPAGLEPVGGVAQLARLADATAAAGLPVGVRVEGDPVPLPAAVDATVHRIAQEALTNALRHAGAGRADLLLRYGRDDVRLSVVDDGRAAPGAQSGMGLRGMRERAELLGGTLRAGRDRAGGFRVEAVLPLGHR